MNYKKPAFWLVLLAAAAALTAAVCLLTVPKQDGQESAADPWGTRIEGLAWGMSPQEAEEKCDLVYRETSDQTKRSSYDVKDPVTIYGCEMSAALIFEEDQGLVQVQGQVAEEDFEKLSDRITEELGEAPSDSEAGQYYIWRSETVGEKYTREQVEGVYAPLLEGTSVDLEEMVKAKMAAPLASCELRRYQSEAGGLLLIDAVNKGFFEKNWQEEKSR